MRIELQIYSGQPNPSWILPANMLTELQELLSNLPRTAVEIAPAGLGYQGLTVTVESGESELFEKLVVFGGLLQCESTNAEWKLLDPERKFERWLLNSGKDYLDENLFRFITQSMGS